MSALPKVDCIDLFCGVGGLTHGLINGGVDVLAGIDIDSHCRFPYEANNHSIFLQQDVSTLAADEINILFRASQLKLLAGCAPCQPFSTYSRGKEKKVDNKWELVQHFARLAKEIKPDFITIENVPQLINHDVFKRFLQEIEDYHVWFKVIQCMDYGVPQTRKRLVLIASKYKSIELLSPQDFGASRVTVRQAISSLPHLSAGETSAEDPLHTTSSLSELNLRRIRSSKPGGSWRDWDKSLLADCHRKKSGETYPSVYGRMEWDQPSPTITTQCFGYGNGRFGHPEQDRAISLREASILQTFPKDYAFLPSKQKVSFSTLGRLIGNAVPVKIGEVIAKSIVDHIRKFSDYYSALN